jgi:hypothetical protein
MEYGLSECKSNGALTKTPATLLGIYDKVEASTQANSLTFLITSGPFLMKKLPSFQNWIQGEKYSIKKEMHGHQLRYLYIKNQFG